MHLKFKRDSMSTAYSYIRFSTTEQSKGDSQRRQLEKSQQYAAANGLELDDTLSFNDLGKSAFRGDHAASGGLGLFINAIDEGRVKKGSYLLIENLDRLSRQPAIDALTLLQSIVSRDITVVTLGDGRIYTQDSLRNDPTSLLVSIVVMFRAHEESRLKGARLRSAWTRKKQTDARAGKPITNMTPAWLIVAEDAFQVIEERAATVRLIFDLATKEGLGQRAICTRLKQTKVPAFGRTGAWSETTIRRILTNPAVIGIYQPYSHNPDNPRDRTEQGEAIEGYYPMIVPSVQFYDAQRLRAKALLPRGPRGKGVQTIFTGIVFCSCGATMRRKGASSNDPMERLRCSAGCGRQSWKYEPLEKAILMLLSSDLLPHIEAKESDRKAVQGKLAEAKVKQEKVRTAIAGLTAAIEAGGGQIPVLVQRLKHFSQQEEEADEEVNRLEDDLRNLEAVKQTADSRNEAITAMARAMKADASGQLRERLRYALSRSVDRIVLEDTEELRSIRIEVGSVVRYIDFSRAEKTFWLRGEEDITMNSVNIKSPAGELKAIIP
jgi:DNA invertase Pin-like site-specific DNA recombinase